MRDSSVSRRIVYETISVRTDGIHPARRIGIIILERSKRSRLRFVMKFPNKMPRLEKNRGVTVNLLTPSGKKEFRERLGRFQTYRWPTNIEIAKPAAIAISNRY